MERRKESIEQKKRRKRKRRGRRGEDCLGILGRSEDNINKYM